LRKAQQSALDKIQWRKKKKRGNSKYYFKGYYEHMIKARAHKGGVRIGKTLKKLASICCS
jgi:hypothetical protein